MDSTRKDLSWEQFVPVFTEFVPQLIAALAVLVVGWIVALFVARGVRAALRRSGLSNKIAAWVAGEQGVAAGIETWTGRIIFWLLILLVLVGFFQALGLRQVTEPLLGLLNEVFVYIPRLLGPAILLGVAWIVAKGLQIAVHRALTTARLDERLKSDVEFDGDRPVARAIGDAVYWITLLLFLPAILHALNIGGLLGPVRAMIDELLAYLPNLFAAAVIFFVGWLVARVLRRVVTNVLAAVGTDELSDRVGLRSALGDQRLSGLIGLVVYVLVLIPVIVAGLNALAIDAVTAPASQMLHAFLDAIPKIFAASLVLVIAWIVGRIVAGLVENLLRSFGFDTLLTRLGLPAAEAAMPPTSLSNVAGTLVFVAIVVFASVEALHLIGFDAAADLGTIFLLFAANILVGIAIIGFGVFLAGIIARSIRATGAANAGLLATTAKVSVIVLAIAMGLGQMGLAEEIIVIAFAVLFGSIALAAAIAFGLGSRETAGRLFDDWVKALGAGRGPTVGGA